MAQQVTGRRDVVQDPLRQSAQQVLPDRSVQLTGVRGPSMPSMAGFSQQQAELNQAMVGLNDVLNNMFEEQKDTWITEGKTAYMSGVTEAELMKNGNRYTQMGYLQLKARNDVNQWYMQEQADLLDKSRSMAPEAYQEYLGARRKEFLDGIADPYAKKVAVAAFEQINPDLASKQFTQNNAYNLEQRDREVQKYLDTGSISSPSKGVVVPGESSLKLSPQPVEPVMQSSELDRDLGIKTLIGEAGNQGEFGMAAVAHVIRNRATDSRYPQSISGVVKQKNQFSVWNSGKEGRASSLNALGPGNPIYDKAAKVYDAVMSGRHVDPTGGALFYHSPSGMKAYAKSGVKVSQATLNRTRSAEGDPNSIRIGGHVFYGKTDGSGRVMRASQEPVEEQGDGGYVDPMVSAPNYDPTAGEQFPGKAKDDLVPSATADNTRGTPAGNSLNDINNQAITNEGVTGVEEAGAPNETLDFIRNYKGLPKDRMAANVAASMARQLDAGNDQLFSDVGGVSILYELGAAPADIDRVMKAKARYDEEQDRKYDEDDLKFEDDILKLADDENTDPQDLLDRIQERVTAGAYTDEQGKSLARSALATIRQNEAKDQAELDAEAKREKAARESAFNNPDFMKEIGGLYQQISGNSVTYDEAVEQSKEIGERYGITAVEAEKVLGQVWQHDQQRQNALRTKAEAALAETATSKQNKSEVDQALGRGLGLATVTGDVKIIDQNGSAVRMTAQEYGILKIKQEAMARHMKEDGTVDAAAVSSEVFVKLQAHGVVDKQTKAQFTAAMTGPIIDPKTKEVNKDAQEAYDLYTTLRRNPQINEGYLAEIVGDAYTRNILELAYTLDAGNLTGPQALVRAKELAANKDFDPNSRIGRDAVFQTQTRTAANELLTELTKPGFWTRLGGFYDGSELNRAVQFGGSLVSQKLMAAADAYHIQFPWQDPAASLELAKQDVKKDLKLVAGNILVTSDKLHEKMGLQDPASVDTAIKDYVAKFGSDLFFNGDFAEYLKATTKEQLNPLDGPNSAGGQYSLPVKVQWMPNIGENGSFMFYRIIDTKTGNIDTSRQVIIPAERIGNWYATEQSQPNVFQRMFDSTRHGLAAAARQAERNHTAAKLGAAVGARTKQ